MATQIDYSNLSEASVYCGTYAKYNNGDLTGKWLKFSDYNDSEEFFNACKELHSDEADPEFMFQDFENLPEKLYSESLSEGDVDKIYELVDFAAKIDGWDDSDWLSAHNTYCGESDPDNQIFDFDDDFFNIYFDGKPMEAARAASFGQVNWSDDYIKFNGYGNLESIDKWSLMSHIDQEEIIKDMIENPRNYNL